MALTSWRRTRCAVLVGAAVLLVPAVIAAAGLSEAERRGKRIYIEGRGRGPISAYLVGPRLSAPGSAFPCANCHLGEGPGVKEGGVQAADIRHATLTKAFEGVRPSGRAHPPYADGDLERAVAFGADPGGNALHEAHPRYAMSPDDLADLVAYLKIVGREPVPGVTEREVRVGVLLPDRGPLAEAGNAVTRLLRGYFDEVNARGGLFRRALTLVPVLFDPAREDSVTAAVREVVEEENLFCLLANVGVPPDHESLKALSAAQVPVIAPLQVALDGGYGADRYTFHVWASIRDQARVMVDFLTQAASRAPARLAVLHVSDASGEAAAAGAREQLAKHGRSVVAEVAFAPGRLSAPEIVSRLRDASAEAVLFFGSGTDVLAFLDETERQQWRPLVLAPAPMVGRSLLSLPAGVARSVYLASPIASPDPAARETAEFLRLAARSAGSGDHRSFQMLAFAGAKLLEEGLRRSGRDVSRQRVVDALGSLWRFPTGVTPPLTYSGNRRVGALGSQILAIDAEQGRLTVAAPWREPR
ncbi:MAG: ABC transporter substrate-binding protein [Candidatus Rokubacteria bacterium]|nr:ABC transporter substrate-binding protein [Candidatus Rokubacteria bacterium]